MKILLIASNRNHSPFPVAPLGVLYIASAAEAVGHQVDFIDMTFSRSPLRKLRGVLKKKKYDAVGLGIRNLDDCVWKFQETYFDEITDMVREIRRLTQSPLILGGSGFSIAPKGWMDRLQPDYGIIGEGEKAFIKLLDNIANEADKRINGVVNPGSSGEHYVRTVNSQIRDSIFPAHHLCRYGKYLSGGGFVSIQTKRGCPFHCIFCNYPKLEGRDMRFREPGLVADEIEYLSRANKGCYIYLTDSVFNASTEHATELCNELIKRRLKVPWIAYCNPLGFDAEFANTMAAAGCIGTEMTLDAVTEKMLRALGKSFSQSDIRRSLQAASSAGIATAVYLLFGGPGETAVDVKESASFLDSCSAPNAVFASLGIRIYSGTTLEKIARDNGLLSANSDLFSPHYYISEGLGKDPLCIVDDVAHNRWEWTTPTDWSRFILRVIPKIINRAGTRPQWRDIRNYGRYIRRF